VLSSGAVTTFRTATIWKGALSGGVLAGVLNVGLFFAAKASGAKLVMTPKSGPPMPIPPFMPMVNCVMGAVVAAAVLTGLVKLLGERAFRVFLGVAALVFIGYAALPVMALGGDTTSIVFLELMHVPAAIGIVGGIWRAHRAESA
jgi:hypothetical protein